MHRAPTYESKIKDPETGGYSSMKLICPSCGATHSACAWLNDPLARQSLVLAGSMQYDVSSRCFAYLSLFRAPGRSLQWRTILKLLAELQELVSEPEIRWKKQAARMNSPQMWGIALDRLIENPPARLPLKSHGYLTSIAYEVANDFDRQNEVKRNQAERNGTLHRREHTDTGQERIFLDVDEMKKIAKKARK